MVSAVSYLIFHTALYYLLLQKNIQGLTGKIGRKWKHYLDQCKQYGKNNPTKYKFAIKASYIHIAETRAEQDRIYIES